MHKSQIFLIILIVFLAGSALYSIFCGQKSVDEYKKFFGVVIEEPEESLESLKLAVNPDDTKDKVIVYANLYPKYQYGDYLFLSCHLKSKNNNLLCYSPKIELAEGEGGNFFEKNILRLKNFLIFKINQILPEPQASFLAGLLVGKRSGIPQEIKECFNKVGITHIIAISGYNITIITQIVLSFCLLIGISRKRSFWASLLVVFFFVVICGMPSSVIRAGVMGLVVLLAQNHGRATKMLNVLLLTAAIMTLLNPKVLIFDVGFQLSFSATVGLIYLSPLIKMKNEVIKTTLSAIIFTLPLIIYYFGRVSLVALIVNILVLPVIPLSMALGFVCLVLALIWLPLGQIFGWLVWLVLTYIVKISQFFASLPFSSLELPKIPWQLVGAVYILLIFWIAKKRSII